MGTWRPTSEGTKTVLAGCGALIGVAVANLALLAFVLCAVGVLPL